MLGLDHPELTLLLGWMLQGRDEPSRLGNTLNALHTLLVIVGVTPGEMGHCPWFQILCSYSYAKVILSPMGKMGHKAKNLTVLPEGIYLRKSVKNPRSLEERKDVIHHGDLG